MMPPVPPLTIRPANGGENHYNWKGGVSFSPYCPKFTNEFKERVREFFGRKCVECGEPENGRRLSIHHVNYRKDSCCVEEVAPLFVTLCHSCHMKTNGNREYWEARFTALINERYGGKCYLPKEGCSARPAGRRMIARAPGTRCQSRIGAEKISLNIPEKLLAEVDAAVTRANKEEKRSSFIRNAIRNELDRRKEA